MRITAGDYVVLMDSSGPVLRSSHWPVVSGVMRLVRSPRDDQRAINPIYSHSSRANSIPAGQIQSP
jgi:hypothetical protein